MNATYSNSFLAAREAALLEGNADKYNAFDRLYKAALVEEQKEVIGKLNVFNNC